MSVCADRHVGSLFLSACGCGVRIDCDNPAAHKLIVDAFGALAVDSKYSVPSIYIRVGIDSKRRGFVVHRESVPAEFAQDKADLLYLVDKALIVGLQHHRPSLFFLHAAVVEIQHKAVILAAPSGTGKSTLTWFMVNHGFRYLSDELAPIDVDTFCVHPYPRALHLKTAPSTPPLGEARLLQTDDTSIHLAAENLPSGVVLDVLPLSGIFFLERNDSNQTVIGSRLRVAMGAARLMANSLNALAHSGEGLDPALSLAGRIPSYVLDSSDLSRAHNAIVDVLAHYESA